MNKALFGRLALSAVSSAAADAVGAYIGTGLGVSYRNERNAAGNIRVALDLDAVNLIQGGALQLGGDAAYLRPIPAGANFGGATGLNSSYGVGVGAFVAFGSPTGVGVYPHALLGLEDQITAPVSVFAEGNLGPRVILSTGGSDFRLLKAGARVGVNYTFR